MRLLGLDFETQCDDAENTNITEVGAVELIWTPGGEEEFKVETTYSTLVYSPEYPPQKPEIVELTGLTDEMLKAEGTGPGSALVGLLPLVNRADVILAHNKKFDQRVFESSVKRVMGIEPPKKEWLCTIHDVPYPAKYRCKKLSHLAYDHGLKMDDRVLHRATDDVRLMLELVTTKYPFKAILDYYREPWVYLRADILGPWQGKGGDGGVGKEQATSLGYAWEKPRGTDEPVFPKFWVKRVKARQVEQEKMLAPFRVVVL